MARTPLYQAAETEMIARITRGDWEVGRRLPNEFELADEFGVSQGTMRRALISLEGMGLLNRKPGRGTLVAANAPRAGGSGEPTAMVPVLGDATGAPLDFETFRARASTRGATPDEADLFGTARLSVLERTLKSGGNRAAMDEVVVPEPLAPSLPEDGPVALGDLVEALGMAPARITAEAGAEMTDMSRSVALSVDRHTALLRVVLTAWAADASPLARQTLLVAVPGAQLRFE